MKKSIVWLVECMMLVVGLVACSSAGGGNTIVEAKR